MQITVAPTNTFQNDVKELCRNISSNSHNNKTSFGSGLVCMNKETGEWYEVGTPTLSEM